MSSTLPAQAVRARDLVDTATLYRICALAPCDPRTADKVILGQPVRGDVATRIRVVLAEMGIEPLRPAANSAEGKP